MPPQQPALTGLPPAVATGTPATWQDLVSAEATKHGIDPRLALAIAETESSFRPTAVSPKGARGIMQLMPGTAKRHGVDPADPVANIRGGMAEFKQLLDANQGDVVKALRLYNGSPQAAPELTEPYVQAVLKRLQGGAGAKPSLGRLQVGQPPPGSPAASPDPAAADTTPAHLRDIHLLPGETERPAFDPSTPIVNPTPWWQGALGEMDVTTRRGRRNIAGGVGAVGGAMLSAPTFAFAGPMGPATGALVGAGLAGGAVEAGEQIVGGLRETLTGEPPATALNLGKVGAAAGEQVLYEAGGQAFMWPWKALGRQLVASKVAKGAHAGLAKARATTMATLNNALEAASATAGDVKRLAGETVRFARRQTAQTLRGARRQARADVQTAETIGAEGVERAAAPYGELVGQPPSTAAAGRAAARQIEGPATDARNLVGKQVDAAAQSGPPVDITALKQEAQAILARISPPEQTFPRQVAEEGVEAARIGASEFAFGGQSRQLLEQQAAAGDPTAAATLRALGVQGMQEGLESAQADAARETLKHPAMGILNRILNAGDTVPFYDAHLWKSELQNALAGTYDKVQKKQVTSITQKLAGELRGALAVHPPYNEATAAYQAIVPLYTKEYAAKLKRAALTDPESLVRMINPRKPTAARMLRDVIVTQSAEGGDAAGGQRAWDLVRSAWTHENLLRGGIEQLDANLAKLPQEFSGVFYGDQSGEQVLLNLRAIASAYKVAKQQAGEGVDAAKAAGQAGIETTRRMGEASIEQASRGAEQVRGQAAADIAAARKAKQVARAPTTAETAFAESSLGGRQLGAMEIGAHALRVLKLGPGQIWGGLSLMRLLLGPKGKDLVTWAAYSSPNTQKLVQALTSPDPGMLVADLVRASGILPEVGALQEEPKKGKLTATIGTPPPR